ncbi:hypothetical protein IAI27_11330, partial [Streptococcus pseudopneumoniae]|uniref:hypothetical protein n=1 Tax=Streptococcus pseudopneumoniae TaxID=257758 RepID=UPI0018B08716
FYQVNRPVCLDEVYLEELESYQRFRVVYDAKGGMKKMLDYARETAPEKLHALRLVTLEQYGKVVGAAVRQGLVRKTQG